MPASFAIEFSGRVINIHPSILPAYPGESVIPKQWEEKALPAGCTLHYVDAGVDTGEIVEQGYIAKEPKDYEAFSSYEEFEEDIHAKEDGVLCRGIKNIVAERRS